MGLLTVLWLSVYFFPGFSTCVFLTSCLLLNLRPRMFPNDIAPYAVCSLELNEGFPLVSYFIKIFDFALLSNNHYRSNHGFIVFEVNADCMLAISGYCKLTVFLRMLRKKRNKTGNFYFLSRCCMSQESYFL